MADCSIRCSSGALSRFAVARLLALYTGICRLQKLVSANNWLIAVRSCYLARHSCTYSALNLYEKLLLAEYRPVCRFVGLHRTSTLVTSARLITDESSAILAGCGTKDQRDGPDLATLPDFQRLPVDPAGPAHLLVRMIFLLDPLFLTYDRYLGASAEPWLPAPLSATAVLATCWSSGIVRG